MICFKRISAMLLICLTLLSLVSCTKHENERMVYAMDTLITFKVSDTSSELEYVCDETIGHIESLISKTKDGSDIYAFNHGEDTAFSTETKELISRVLTLCELTDGAYDPTVATLSELWDITGDAKIPGEDEIAEALSHVGYEKLSLDGNKLVSADPDVMLDLGGAGKGYACEKVIDILSETLGYGLVSFGSSIGVYGTKPDGKGWNIAITDPYTPDSTIGYVTIDHGFISVSGDYERFAEIEGQRYCHIIDPETGYPISNEVHSVVVYTEDAVAGDVLSTALMVTGKEGIEKFKNAGIEFEALVISEGGYTMTDKMKNILTLYEEK